MSRRAEARLPTHADFRQHDAFTREQYEKSFAPAYESLGVHPRRLLRVPVLLPFHVPVSNGSTFTFALDASSAATLTFETLATRHVVHADLVVHEPGEVIHHRTRAVLTYATEDEAFSAADELAATAAFDRMLLKLNTFLTAYVLVTKDYAVHRVNKEMFEFASFVAVIDPRDWQRLHHGLFLLHMHPTVTHPELAPELLERVAWFTHVLEEEMNPFAVSEELAVAATRELMAGAFQEAIVFAQTAVETQLSLLLRHAMRQEGKADSEIDAYFDSSTFGGRLRRDFHTRFGGDWNVKGSDSIVSRWHDSLYRLRNRVVHSGLHPTGPEASVAVESGAAFREFMVARVQASAHRYSTLQPFFESRSAT